VCKEVAVWLSERLPEPLLLPLGRRLLDASALSETDIEPLAEVDMEAEVLSDALEDELWLCVEDPHSVAETLHVEEGQKLDDADWEELPEVDVLDDTEREGRAFEAEVDIVVEKEREVLVVVVGVDKPHRHQGRREIRKRNARRICLS
jgi:hypothetical protein